MKTAMEAHKFLIFHTATMSLAVYLLIGYDHRSSSIQFRDHGSYTECSSC
jgi:hypothetical protein